MAADYHYSALQVRETDGQERQTGSASCQVTSGRWWYGWVWNSSPWSIIIQTEMDIPRASHILSTCTPFLPTGRAWGGFSNEKINKMVTLTGQNLIPTEFYQCYKFKAICVSLRTYYWWERHGFSSSYLNNARTTPQGEHLQGHVLLGPIASLTFCASMSELLYYSRTTRYRWKELRFWS